MLSIRAILLSLAVLTGLAAAARAQVDEEIQLAIADYAAMYNVPEALVHRVVKRESKYNPNAYHRGNWGLMQIKYATARAMGYRGTAKGLLDYNNNLRFGVKYLAGAYIVAGGNADRAVRYYASGYYYIAKRKGLLEAVGLKTKRARKSKKASAGLESGAPLVE